jgi:hypothetical protein
MKGAKEMKANKSILFYLAVMLIVPVSVKSAEVRFPVPCYEGQELEKVRQWEQQWAGKKIDKTNIEGVKEFVPENYYKLFIDPNYGGDYFFEIVPYQQTMPTKGDLEATLKYAGTCTIDAKDDLQNYVNGIPFPNPTTALEIMYNFDNINMGESLDAIMPAWLIDGKRKYDRNMVVHGRMLWFAGRRDVPPVPEILPNDKGIYRGSHSDYLEPANMEGTRSMQIKYKDRSREWGSWTFASANRRLMRRSTAQRQSSLGGTDVTFDDDFIWSWNISANNYKLLGRKEILHPRHQDIEKLRNGHREGYCLANNLMCERINTYALEVVSKDPNYIYSKQIFYVDPETWWILYADKYDRLGKLWKVALMYQYLLNSSYNESLVIPHMAALHYVDVQRQHATLNVAKAKIGLSGPEQQPTFYEPQSLMRQGY